MSLEQLGGILERFIVKDYNQRLHSQTGEAPAYLWGASGFIPCSPARPDDLDLLLLIAAATRKVQRDGIQFASTRYISPVLAACVGEHVTVRFNPRDVGEIRVYFNDEYLCRAIPRNSPRAPSRSKNCKLPCRDDGVISSSSCGNAAASPTPCPLTPAARPPTPPTWSRQPPKKLHHGTDCACMPPINPGHNLLSKDDDGRRFLTGDFGEVNTSAPPLPDRLPFQTIREHPRFTEFVDTVREHRYIGLC